MTIDQSEIHMNVSMEISSTPKPYVVVATHLPTGMRATSNYYSRSMAEEDALDHLELLLGTKIKRKEKS